MEIKNQIKNFWFVRLVIIIGGFYGVFTFLQFQWSLFSLVAIASILIIAIASVLFQRTTHAEALKAVKNKSKIIQKLEDCC